MIYLKSSHDFFFFFFNVDWKLKKISLVISFFREHLKKLPEAPKKNPGRKSELIFIVRLRE